MISRKSIFSWSLLLACLPAAGQNYGQRSDRGYSNQDQNYESRQTYHRSSRFDNGLRDGGRGGQYYDPRHANDGYDQRYQQNDGYYQQDHQNNGYYQQNQGGIGPGKGALIGGAGGAILGALFGGGLKGTLIGGAAGAGIGAAVGEVHQSNQRRNNSYGR